MRRLALVLLALFALLAAGPARAKATAGLEGWREFRFGMSRDQVMAILGDRGEVHGGAVHTTADIGGATYDALLKFRSDRLHEVFLMSGLGRAKPQPDQECYTYHMGLVGDTEATYGIKGETDAASIGTGVRYIFTRTRFPFADGAKIMIESKFVPSLVGGGLCESTILYQETERTGHQAGQ